MNKTFLKGDLTICNHFMQAVDVNYSVELLFTVIRLYIIYNCVIGH